MAAEAHIDEENFGQPTIHHQISNHGQEGAGCKGRKGPILAGVILLFSLAIAGLVFVLILGRGFSSNSQPDPPQSPAATDSANNCTVSCDSRICEAPYPRRPGIGYQIHSWDDLREWPQMLKKKVDWIKVDVHYVQQEVCSKQLNVLQPADDRGCFLLCHDSPVERNSYNTSQDLISFIQNPKHIANFQSDSKVFIALCFKTEFDVCSNTTENEDYISLIDDLFSDYNKIVSQFNLSLEFVLDGAATPGGNRTCLQQKWRPWNCTYSSSSDPQKAFVSNDPLDGSDRFQVLNTECDDELDPTKYLIPEAKQNFGKFINSTYPFINWEPSSQDDILKVVDAYSEYGPLHRQGFYFAINIDPIQLDVFTASRTATNVTIAWNRCLKTQGQSSRITTVPYYSPSTYPSRIPLPINASTPIGFILNVFQSSGSPTSVLYQVIQINGWVLGGTIESPTIPLVGASNSQPISVSAVEWNAKSSLVVVGYASGDVGWYYFDYALKALRFTGLTSSIGNSSMAVDVSCQLGSPIQSCFVSQIVSTSECGALLKLWQITDIDPNDFLLTLINGTSQLCLSSQPISGASLSTIQMPINEPILCPLGSFVGIAVMSTSVKQIIGSSFCFNPTDGLTKAISTPPDKFLDVGSTPSVEIKFDIESSSIRVLEVHNDGFCWNSHQHNIGAAVATCDQVPVSNNYILSYNYGTMASWKERISSGTLITVCDEEILHGVYDTGSHPQISLFYGPFVPEFSIPRLGVVEIHQGMPEIADSDGECGLALPYGGFVLDSWTLNPELKR